MAEQKVERLKPSPFLPLPQLCHPWYHKLFSYFQASIDSRVSICGQLVGVSNFLTTVLDFAPVLIKLRTEKVALLQSGKYTLVNGIIVYLITRPIACCLFACWPTLFTVLLPVCLSFCLSARLFFCFYFASLFVSLLACMLACFFACLID